MDDEEITAAIEAALWALRRDGVPMDRITRIHAHVWEARYVVYDDPVSPGEASLCAYHYRLTKLIAMGLWLLGHGEGLSRARETALVELVELERSVWSPDSIAVRERRQALSDGGHKGALSRRRGLVARNRAIRIAARAGLSVGSLALRFGLSTRQIRTIIKKKKK
jgi:hypothetical protein